MLLSGPSWLHLKNDQLGPDNNTSNLRAHFFQKQKCWNPYFIVFWQTVFCKKTNLAQIITPQKAKLGPDNKHHSIYLYLSLLLLSISDSLSLSLSVSISPPLSIDFYIYICVYICMYIYIYLCVSMALSLPLSIIYLSLHLSWCFLLWACLHSMMRVKLWWWMTCTWQAKSTGAVYLVSSPKLMQCGSLRSEKCCVGWCPLFTSLLNSGGHPVENHLELKQLCSERKH